MSHDLRIGYLVDHPKALPTLERLFQSEWAAYYGPAGPGNAQQDLVAYSNRDQLPVGVVAFVGSEPCGVAALKEHPSRYLTQEPRFYLRSVG